MRWLESTCLLGSVATAVIIVVLALLRGTTAVTQKQNLARNVRVLNTLRLNLHALAMLLACYLHSTCSIARNLHASLQ